jgi:putative membrane protein
MIVLDKRSWLRMVFALRGSSLRQTWPRIGAVTAFAILVTWLDAAVGIKGYSLTTTPFTLIGLAMAIFLGFRNNESYDRFWEGRTLWGRLVNVSRSFTRQTLTLIVPKSKSDSEQVDEIRRRLVRTTIAYVHALRHHLRDSDPNVELTTYLPKEDRAEVNKHTNVPVGVLY